MYMLLSPLLSSLPHLPPPLPSHSLPPPSPSPFPFYSFFHSPLPLPLLPPPPSLAVGNLIGFVACLYSFTALMPFVMRRSSAALINISLLTSDFYGLIFGVFLFNYTVSWIVLRRLQIHYNNLVSLLHGVAFGSCSISMLSPCILHSLIQFILLIRLLIQYLRNL